MVLAQIDWGPIVKIYGAWGVILVVVVILGRALLKYIKEQHKAHAAELHEQIVEARKERDYSRELRTQEVNKFIDSLRLRDEKMERGFDEVVQAIRDTRRK